MSPPLRYSSAMRTAPSRQGALAWAAALTIAGVLALGGCSRSGEAASAVNAAPAAKPMPSSVRIVREYAVHNAGPQLAFHHEQQKKKCQETLRILGKPYSTRLLTWDEQVELTAVREELLVTPTHRRLERIQKAEFDLSDRCEITLKRPGKRTVTIQQGCRWITVDYQSRTISEGDDGCALERFVQAHPDVAREVAESMGRALGVGPGQGGNVMVKEERRTVNGHACVIESVHITSPITEAARAFNEVAAIAPRHCLLEALRGHPAWKDAWVLIEPHPEEVEDAKRARAAIGPDGYLAPEHAGKHQGVEGRATVIEIGRAFAANAFDVPADARGFKRQKVPAPPEFGGFMKGPR
ncbi:MAG: hypothetical protein N2688_03010 [Burkholderiaceae bacterium]|nr:hypothetical protein [Burkholderiaceae bacterium]